jgi:hypothetical protein
MNQYAIDMISSFLESLHELEESYSNSSSSFDPLSLKAIRYQNDVNKWIDSVELSLESAKLHDYKDRWVIAKELVVLPTTINSQPFSPLNKHSIKGCITQIRGILHSFLVALQEDKIPEPFITIDLLEGSRKYIARIAKEANRCYENRCFDSCFVQLRRLVELLIRDCFDLRGLNQDIRDGNSELFPLSKLIDKFKEKKEIFLYGRNINETLDKIKKLGDQSAHGENPIPKQTVQQLGESVRDVIVELCSIAYEKSGVAESRYE